MGRTNTKDCRTYKVNQMKKILFINFGGIGDEILFLPAIQAVKKTFPDSEITLALEERSKGITSLTNSIDSILTANIKGKCKYFELFKLLLKIWTKRFDMVVSSGGNKFISIFLLLTCIREKYGYDTGILSRMFFTKAVKLNKNQYAGNMYFDLVSGISTEKFELPKLDIERKNVKYRTVLIHPGVSKLSVKQGMIKTVKPEVWADVIKLLNDNYGFNVILAGGPDDKECIQRIVELVPSDKFENYYGNTKNLKELAELISSCEKFVCSDSAPLHIAVALSVKTYVIFGSTDEKKLIPKDEKFVPIKSDIKCPLQPCLWERRQTTCKELTCLNISADKIAETISKF